MSEMAQQVKTLYALPGSGFDPGIPHGGRRELTFQSCSLTFHMCHEVDAHTFTSTASK